jgi:SNF2 family DNA or RNA helicase
MVAKFQEDDSCRLFIGCAPACREGLTLTAATHVVFLDCEWSPAYVEQAFSRAHRIGQKDAVTVYYLVCEETIDEYVQDVLERKDALAQTMLDEGIESVGAIRAKEMIQIMATGKVA